jgi:hypothetical protein
MADEFAVSFERGYGRTGQGERLGLKGFCCAGRKGAAQEEFRTAAGKGKPIDARKDADFKQAIAQVSLGEDSELAAI